MAEGSVGWEAILDATRSAPVSPNPLQATAWQVDERDVTEFGGFSLEDDVDVVACEHCHKPIIREAYSFHQGAHAS